MCGIAGEVSFKDSLIGRKDMYIAMGDTLAARGPDEEGLYITDEVALVHRRLAVIDIERGKQPMSAVLGKRKYTICYNGELYNTAQLRLELMDNGMTFKTRSDTEVVLKSFIFWGEECVNKFNGIFAFVIWDEFNKRLFLARDRMGVKPLFYTLVDGSFIFASEIKALLKHRKVKAQIDISGIEEVMLLGPGRTMGCGVFKGISEIPVATSGFFNEYGLRLKKYWELTVQEHRESFEDTLEHTRYLVIDSIERQLVSDVPVATFLSGGLDSSLISSVANNYFKSRGKKLTTFSLDYKDNDKNFKSSHFQPNSDSEYIGIMQSYLDCDGRNVIIDTEELVGALYDAVRARDLPGLVDVDSSLLLLCKEIKKSATVALSGECADEIFGGYPWYRDKDIREKDGFPWAQSTEYRFSFLNDEYKDMINAEEFVHSKYEATIKSVKKPKNISSTDSRMMEMMRLNTDWFMQNLLERKDRMSMYCGLEVRVPFCDYRIAQYMYNVPWEYKDYRNYEKGLLRCAAVGLLPDEVLWRKKSPYPKTHNPNYLAAVRKILRGIIDDKNAPIHAITSKTALEGLLVDERATPWYGQLMTTPQTIAYFIELNFWLKEYNISIV